MEGEKDGSAVPCVCAHLTFDLSCFSHVCTGDPLHFACTFSNELLISASRVANRGVLNDGEINE